jgi:hypothetical protein
MKKRGFIIVVMYEKNYCELRAPDELNKVMLGFILNLQRVNVIDNNPRYPVHLRRQLIGFHASIGQQFATYDFI